MALGNSPWQNCNAVHQGVMLQSEHYGYDTKLRAFRSSDGAVQAVFDFDDAIAACRLTVQQRVFALFQPNWFGSILDVGNVALSASKNERDELASQRARIIEIDDAFLARHNLTWTDALHSFINPAPSTSSLSSRDKDATHVACEAVGTSGILHLWPLICGQPSPDLMAKKLLSVSTVASFATDLAEWSVTVAPIADISSAYVKGHALDSKTLVAYAAAQPGPGQGRNLLVGSGLATDFGVASASLLEGDMTVDAVYEALTATPVAGDDAAEKRRSQLYTSTVESLRHDKHLAANVAMRMLSDHFGIWDFTTRKKTALTPDPSAYWTSKDRSEIDKQGDIFASLRALFGYDLSFEISPGGFASLVLAKGDDAHAEVTAPLPGRAALLAGAFTFSKDVRDLAAVRARLYDRVLDYDAIALLPAEKRLPFASAISRSAK